MPELRGLRQHAWDRTCPECQQEKHPNCDGTAWDTKADTRCVCACGCREAGK